MGKLWETLQGEWQQRRCKGKWCRGEIVGDITMVQQHEMSWEGMAQGGIVGDVPGETSM